MKDIDNDLLLYTQNLVNSIYFFIYSTTPKDYDFYLWDIKRGLNHIASYKKDYYEII